jgi:hypothetical protein
MEMLATILFRKEQIYSNVNILAFIENCMVVFENVHSLLPGNAGACLHDQDNFDPNFSLSVD